RGLRGRRVLGLPHGPLPPLLRGPPGLGEEARPRARTQAARARGPPALVPGLEERGPFRRRLLQRRQRRRRREAGRVAAGPASRWHFDGTSYHALDTVPRDLKSYFKGERVIEEDDIPQFLSSEFRALMNQSSFKPSKDVEDTKVAPKPTLSALRVKDDTGDWME